jgi:hypothetical protein
MLASRDKLHGILVRLQLPACIGALELPSRPLALPSARGNANAAAIEASPSASSSPPRAAPLPEPKRQQAQRLAPVDSIAWPEEAQDVLTRLPATATGPRSEDPRPPWLRAEGEGEAAGLRDQLLQYRSEVREAKKVSAMQYLPLMEYLFHEDAAALGCRDLYGLLSSSSSTLPC